MISKRLMQDKPIYFLGTDKEVYQIQRDLTRIQLARFFHCAPHEFDNVPETRLRMWLGIVEGLVEYEKEEMEKEKRGKKRWGGLK